MTNDPLNTDVLQHFLNFKNDGYGVKQIDEPIGFDAANFVVKQDKGRYGRDVSFAGEEINFTFTNTKNFYGFEYDKIIEYDKRFGYESEIEYQLYDSNLDVFYIVGQLDFQDKKTDQLNFFSCKMIQSTTQALLKRRYDVKVDLFSDEDLDGNSITPISTSNILIKANPVFQTSEWISSSNNVTATGVVLDQFDNSGSGTHNGFTILSGCNNSNSGVTFQIEDSINYISQVIALNTFTGLPNAENFSFIQAANALTDVTINFTNIDVFTQQSYNDFFSHLVLSGSGYARLVVLIGQDLDNITETHIVYEKTFGYTENTPPEFLPTELSLNIPSIASGNSPSVIVTTVISLRSVSVAS